MDEVITYTLDPEQFRVLVIAAGLVITLLAAQLVTLWGR